MKLEYIHTINEDVLNEGKMRAYLLALAALSLLVGSPFIIKKIIGSKQKTASMIQQGKRIIEKENIPVQSIPIPVELAPIAQSLPVPIPNPIQSASVPAIEPMPAAAQPVQQRDTQDIIYLARILFAEAGNQKRDAKEAVAQIIMNRVAKSKGRKTVVDVITQPYQFTAYDGPLWVKSGKEKLAGLEKKSYDECLDIARKAVSGRIPNHIGVATLYHDDSIDTPETWNKEKIEFVKRIGNFLFYNEYTRKKR